MPPERPFVTVGMPSYNKGESIGEAIESILAQSYPEFELLISDDCSKDVSVAVCEAYARQDARVRFVSQPQNLGMIGNFDYVLDHARGEYFMWFSADDRVDPEWLTACVEACEEGGAIGFGRVEDVRRDGSSKRRYPRCAVVGPRWWRVVRLYWRIVPECNMLHGVTRTARVRGRGGLRPYAFAEQAFDFLYVFESALDGPLAATDGAWLHKRDSINNGLIERGGTASLLRNALLPTIPIRRVLLLHRARLPFGTRLLLAAMFLPRCAYALVQWYAKGLRLLFRRLSEAGA